MYTSVGPVSIQILQIQTRLVRLTIRVTSVQAHLQRFANLIGAQFREYGLLFQARYTFSHSINDGSLWVAANRMDRRT